MTIKDRFTVAVTQGKYSKIVRGIYDHKTNQYITEDEFNEICQKEYGSFLNAKNNLIKKTIELVIAEMEYYNQTCEKGFEITVEDIISNFKSRNKSVF